MESLLHRSRRSLDTRRVLALVAVVLAIPLSSCEVLDAARVDDGHAPLVAGSIVIRPEQFAHRRGGRGGVEFGYERQLGVGPQAVELGHYLQLDRTRIAGPVAVENRARVEHAHIAYNHLFDFGSHFQLEPAVGIAYDDVLLATTPQSSGTTAQFAEQLWGITGGVTGRWRFNAVLAFEVRTRFGVGESGGDTALINPAVVVSPFANLAISGGYLRRWQEVETSTNNSNIKLAFNGPTVALRLSF